MSPRIGWYSQEFQPTGGSAGEGIRNQLGRPAMNLLTILVREAAQNSSDAALRGEQVRFDLHLNTLPPSDAPRWRDIIGTGAPSADHLPLKKSLAKRVRVLHVSDRGTTGLQGPTRADNAVVVDNDFVAFVRNVGEPRDTPLGGGTYGFGKSIFYLLSRCGTILVYTRCQTGAGLESRLIGVSLWDSYVIGHGESGSRFTGRHWWGDTSGPVIEPLLNNDADRLAARLGLPGFEAEETGTTVSIIDPVLDLPHADEDTYEDEAARWLADAVAWHLWPKIVPRADSSPAAMSITVRRNGVRVPVPDPMKTEPLRKFVRAFHGLHSDDASEIECRRPRQRLGRLSFTEQQYSTQFESNRVAEECGFEGTSAHHICLMRSPELVVKYLVGPKTSASFLSYAGVFRADDEVDEAFANAEPPTHDDWIPSQLEVPQRSFVNVALRELKTAAKEQSHSTYGTASDAAVRGPLGSASRRFSGLISKGLGPISQIDDENNEAGAAPGSSHEGSDTAGKAGSGTRSGRHRSPSRRPKLTYQGDSEFSDRDGTPVITQEFRVHCQGITLVSAQLGVVIPGTRGLEADAPHGARSPVVVGWESEDRSEFISGDVLSHPGDGSAWRVLVAPAPDTVTSIGLTVRESE